MKIVNKLDHQDLLQQQYHIRTRSMTLASKRGAVGVAKKALAHSEGVKECSNLRRSARLRGMCHQSGVLDLSVGGAGGSGGDDDTSNPLLDIAATKIQSTYRGHITRESLFGGHDEELSKLLKEDKRLFRSIYKLQEHLQMARGKGIIDSKSYQHTIKELSKVKKEFESVDADIYEYAEKGSRLPIEVFKEKYSTRLDEIRESLASFSKKYGAKSMSEFVSLVGEDALTKIKSSLLGNVSKYFEPLSSHEVDIKYVGKEGYQVEFYKPSEKAFETVLLSAHEYHDLIEGNQPFFIASKQEESGSPYLLQHGASMLIPTGEDKGILVKGVFPNGALSLMHSIRELANKKKAFIEVSNSEIQKIPKAFKNAFIDQLAIKDLILMTEENFLDELKQRHEALKKIEEQSFLDLPDEFVRSSPYEMAQTLKTLIMGGNKGLPLLLYSILLHGAPPIAREVFSSLHFSQQEKLSLAELELNEVKDRLKDNVSDEVTLEARILASSMDKRTMSHALGRLKASEEEEGSEATKSKKWIESLLNLPIGKYAETKVSIGKNTPLEISQFMGEIQETFDNAVHGHDDAKKQVMRVMGQWVANEGAGGEVIALQGPPGNGKTTFAKEGIAKALGRPFCFIALGGAQDSSLLLGHELTYVGSKYGKISEKLMEAKVMNPVIYIDELDKISTTERGREIIGVLTHLLDSSQNKEFEDVYFDGVKLDLSRALFVCSYNDESAIDPILKDRMITVRTKGHGKSDKVIIAKKHLIPKMLKEMSLDPDSIEFSDDMIRYMIDSYTHEAGVRRLKECILGIIREVNLNRLVSSTTTFPIVVDKDLIHECLKKPRVYSEKIRDRPEVGTMNGLYADSLGGGGITIVQAAPTVSDKRLELVLTGSQGGVMQESVRAARTVTWQILPAEIRKRILREEPFGLHLHFTDTAQPKDGPSAGGAITSTMISQLTGVPLRNDVAATGEIDLTGNITAIGGLESKLIGAKKAGVKKVLFPKENLEDFEEAKKKFPALIDENFTAEPVSHIIELLQHVLVPNNLKFEKRLLGVEPAAVR